MKSRAATALGESEPLTGFTSVQNVVVFPFLGKCYHRCPTEQSFPPVFDECSLAKSFGHVFILKADTAGCCMKDDHFSTENI